MVAGIRLDPERARRRSWGLFALGVPLLACLGGAPVHGQDAEAPRTEAKRARAREAAEPESTPPPRDAEVPGAPRAERNGERGDEAAEEPREEERLRALEEAVLAELESAEVRLRSIRRRLRDLVGEPPWPAGSDALEGAPLLRSGAADDRAARRIIEEEKRYAALHKRQEELLRRWAELRGGPQRVKEGASPGAGKTAVDVESELRRVLLEMLDLRDQARERRLRTLRQEIEEIERALARRRAVEERERLVERELRDLLGEAPRR